MWYVSSGRDEERYEDPDRFDVRRNPEHQAFGAGGRHFCLGTALARLELRVLFEETLARYPSMELAGEPTWVFSTFVNQLKTLPVRLGPTLAVAPDRRQRTDSRPILWAMPAASTRRLAPSLRRMFDTCTPAVLGLM